MDKSYYRYPDASDKVTDTFIRQHEPYPGYWEDSEQRALNALGQVLNSTLRSPRERNRALDMGCGDGRLLPWLANFATSLTAAEPDRRRMEQAQKRRADLPPECAIEFQPATMLNTIGGPFDLILCSHVIQHIPTTDLKRSLKYLHKIAAPDGLIALLHSKASVGGETFMLDRVENGRIRSATVSKEEFDEAASTCQDENLPIRFIDPDEFERTMSSTGWGFHWQWTYHILDDFGVLDQYLDRDTLVNQNSILSRDLGRDRAGLWQRNRV